MSYDVERLRRLSAGEVRRLLGVKPATFEAMLAVLKAREEAKTKSGRPPDLSLQEQLVLALQFWREYRTYYHLAAEWDVGENTVCRTIRRVEDALARSGAFALPGRRKAGGAEQAWGVVVLDVTEHPIERPKKSSGPATRARKGGTRSRPRSPSTGPRA